MRFDGQSIEFQSYQGLHQIVTRPQGIHHPFQEMMVWLHRHQYTPPHNGKHPPSARNHQVAKLLDTFLINSITEQSLMMLVTHAIELRVPIQILMLHPFGPFAKARAKRGTG